MLFYFIAPLSTIRKRTRLAKMANYYNSRDIKIIFYGWERVKGEATPNAPKNPALVERHILHGGGYSSILARAFYPVWMIKVFFTALKLQRGDTVFCLGWETAFPALLASKITKSIIIFDDADRFSMILRLPKPATYLLRRLEEWTAKGSFLHVIPGYSRYDSVTHNMLVLKNTPLKEDFVTALTNTAKEPKAALTIYINGWIGETRGAPVFLSLADRFLKKHTSVRFIIAGKIDSKSGEKLIKHPLVSYEGEVDQRTALSIYRQCDVALTFYDPAVEINKKAESNKWGDCIYLETPFIVNSEVETAREYINSGAAFSTPYNDIEDFEALVNSLISNPNMLTNARENIKKLKSAHPLFDEQLEKILSYTLKKSP